MVLTLLAILIAVLVALAPAAAFAPRHAVAIGSAGIAALVALLAVAFLAGQEDASVLALPLGPAGAAMHLALDPLAASVLLFVFVAAIPDTLCADRAPRVSLPLLLAGIALILLAADAFALAAGLLLWAFATSYPPRFLTFGIVCLIAALALAAPAAVPWLDCDFAAIRAVPPEGWRAAAVLLLVLLGATSLAVRQDQFGITAAIYLLMRLVLDLGGTAQPLWWGVPLLLLGVSAAMTGALRAIFAPTLHAVVAAGSLHLPGLAVVGIGVTLLARAVDLPDVAMVGLEATWVLLACHVLCQTLLSLCAGALETGAGTRQLDRLGGLIHRMPVTALCALVGLFGVAAIPPGLGFAGFWLLFQALLAAARIGGFGVPLLVAIVATLSALSVGLAAMAAVRLFGVACLGRPRTPRTAVAEDVPRVRRYALITLASLTALLAVLPALALLPAASALAHLANGGSSPLGFDMTLRLGAEAPGYSVIAIAGLLLIAGIALFELLRRGAAGGERQEAAWSGGFAPPPPWLPFGDPATQYGPASFAEPVRQALQPVANLPFCLPLREVVVGGGAASGVWAAIQAKLLRTVQSVAAASVSRSIAAALVVLILAASAWLAL